MRALLSPSPPAARAPYRRQRQQPLLTRISALLGDNSQSLWHLIEPIVASSRRAELAAELFVALSFVMRRLLPVPSSALSMRARDRCKPSWPLRVSFRRQDSHPPLPKTTKARCLLIKSDSASILASGSDSESISAHCRPLKTVAALNQSRSIIGASTTICRASKH